MNTHQHIYLQDLRKWSVDFLKNTTTGSLQSVAILIICFHLEPQTKLCLKWTKWLQRYFFLQLSICHRHEINIAQVIRMFSYAAKEYMSKYPGECTSEDFAKIAVKNRVCLQLCAYRYIVLSGIVDAWKTESQRVSIESEGAHCWTGEEWPNDLRSHHR